jgi:hypothetical protein
MCLGGWIYNKDNGKCYPPLNSTSKCDNYEHKTMYNYINQTDVNNWMTECNVSNSQNCVFPRPGQLTTQTPSTTKSTLTMSSTTMSPTTISPTTRTPTSPVVPPLYPFTTHTFTTAGKTGPTLNEIINAYSGVSWAQNRTFLNMTKQGIQLWTVPGGGGGSFSITGSFTSATANNNANGFVVITANF